MNIYIGNLPLEISEKDLRHIFQEFGQVLSVNVRRGRFSGGSKDFGFVEMPNEAEARAAIAGLNGRELRGRSLVVYEGHPRSAGHGYEKKHGEDYLGGGRRLW